LHYGKTPCHVARGMPKPRKSAFDEPYIEIISRLIARRHDLKMTQAELAAAYGEDQSFISRIERRQRRIDVWEFIQLCRVLQLDPAKIIRDFS
jgi:ribosome-binding protein aMBF1 (putative translation factor)